MGSIKKRMHLILDRDLEDNIDETDPKSVSLGSKLRQGAVDSLVPISPLLKNKTVAGIAGAATGAYVGRSLKSTKAGWNAGRNMSDLYKRAVGEE